jgi:hypothetical protein
MSSMRNPNNRPIDDLVFDCCAQLLSSYQLDARSRSRDDFPAVEALALCGVMGFGGKQMRGSLVLAATREPLELTNPGGVTSQRDWICELANQLLGRIKNRLLASGIEILLATPAGLSGDNLCFTLSRLRAPQVFAAAQGYVCVWIDCEFAEGFELPPSILTAAGTALPEGETVLF